MTQSDKIWIRSLQKRDLIRGPVLELGTGYGGETSKDLILTSGLEYTGTDLVEGSNVDVAADFEQSEQMARFANHAPFGTVLMLNVLEHTFDPIRVIDNAMRLLCPGGRCVILVPSIWPLHNFPMDAWRVLPNFFEEYAARRKVMLDKETFEWIQGGAVSQHLNVDGSYRFPDVGRSPFHSIWSRLIHRLFKTSGRGVQFGPHLAIGAVLQRPN